MRDPRLALAARAPRRACRGSASTLATRRSTRRGAGKIFGIFFILFGLAKIFTIIANIGLAGVEAVVSRILDAADDDPTDNKKPHGTKFAISCGMIIVCVFTGSIWFYVSVARGVARVRAAPARGRGGFSRAARRRVRSRARSAAAADARASRSGLGRVQPHRRRRRRHVPAEQRRSLHELLLVVFRDAHHRRVRARDGHKELWGGGGRDA